MRANVGDQITVPGRSVGMADHSAEILEIRGDDGAPPYVVRFDDGQEGLIYPGPDSVVRPR
nr:DUF1918 domain-containing protein [Nocardia miyunensis]